MTQSTKFQLLDCFSIHMFGLCLKCYELHKQDIKKKEPTHKKITIKI